MRFAMPDIGWNPVTVRLMQVGLWVTFAFVTGTMLALLWYRVLDPVAPRIVVHSTELIDHSGGYPDVLDRPGVFEVRRVIESSATASGTLHAYFVQRSSGRPLELPDGRMVVPDDTRFETAAVRVVFDKGVHLRDRIWEVPRLLPPGDYYYYSRVEFCNVMLRCVWVDLPGVPVVLSGEGWPGGRRR